MPLKFQLDRLTLTPVRLRGKSDSKTDKTHRRIVYNYFFQRFGGFTCQIGSYLEVDFLHDANTSMGHGSKMVSVEQRVKNFYLGKLSGSLLLEKAFFTKSY